MQIEELSPTILTKITKIKENWDVFQEQFYKTSF